jgi:hypothetical protein
MVQHFGESSWNWRTDSWLVSEDLRQCLAPVTRAFRSLAMGQLIHRRPTAGKYPRKTPISETDHLPDTI